MRSIIQANSITSLLKFEIVSTLLTIIVIVLLRRKLYPHDKGVCNQSYCRMKTTSNRIGVLLRACIYVFDKNSFYKNSKSSYRVCLENSSIQSITQAYSSMV